MTTSHTGNLAIKHADELKFTVYAKHKPTRLYLGCKGMMLEKRMALHAECGAAGMSVEEFTEFAMQTSGNDYIGYIAVEDIVLETEVQ